MKISSKNQKRGIPGKIVLTDFHNLRPVDFKNIYGEISQKEINNQFFLVQPDGRVYINSRKQASGVIAEAFTVLSNENKEYLTGLEKRLKKKYPAIGDVDDILAADASADERGEMLCLLVIPLELLRRQVEKEYYG